MTRKSGSTSATGVSWFLSNGLFKCGEGWVGSWGGGGADFRFPGRFCHSGCHGQVTSFPAPDPTLTFKPAVCRLVVPLIAVPHSLACTAKKWPPARRTLKTGVSPDLARERVTENGSDLKPPPAAVSERGDPRDRRRQRCWVLGWLPGLAIYICSPAEICHRADVAPIARS